MRKSTWKTIAVIFMGCFGIACITILKSYQEELEVSMEADTAIAIFLSGAVMLVAAILISIVAIVLHYEALGRKFRILEAKKHGLEISVKATHGNASFKGKGTFQAVRDLRGKLLGIIMVVPDGPQYLELCKIDSLETVAPEKATEDKGAEPSGE